MAAADEIPGVPLAEENTNNSHNEKQILAKKISEQWESTLNSPIHDACQQGDAKELAKQLDNKGDTEIFDLLDRKSVGGNTPLHWACRKQHVGIVKTLVEKLTQESLGKLLQNQNDI